MRRSPLLLVLLLTLGACAGNPGSPRPTPAPRTPTPRDPLAAPWIVQQPGMHRVQRLTVRSQLVSQVDSVVKEDSLESTLDVAWSEVPDATPARVAGMVQRFAVRVPPDSQSFVPAGLTLPFSFVAVREPGAVPQITIPESSRCDLPNAMAIQGWRELWIPLPERIVDGQRWQDSTSYTFCRDGIPLAVTVLRTFTAVGAEERGGDIVLRIDRDSRQWLEGEGTQFGEPVRISGEGEGLLRLTVSLAGGVILKGEGTSTLRVKLEGRRRQQALVQTSLVQITAPQ